MKGLSLQAQALAVLTTADAEDKANLTLHFVQQNMVSNLEIASRFQAMPDRPTRPLTPVLRAPKDMPKRPKLNTENGRNAVLHAIAHIELNAMDLAWDLIGRFSLWQGQTLPNDFFQNWLQVAGDEAKHFMLLQKRLKELNSYYGALPAHDGLWEAAQKTANDFAARLAVVPMVLEARGLDMAPLMMKNLQAVGDTESAKILQIIHDEEIPHVAYGKKWFEWVANQQGIVDYKNYWQQLIKKYYGGSLKEPFNQTSRNLADFPGCWYLPLAG